MKRTAWLAILAVFSIAHGEEPKIEPQKGRCLGGNQPSVMCKDCSTCFYCGKKGRWGKRPENSATCAVCAHARAMGS